MSTAISYVNITSPIPYALPSDINNLIGSVISAADISTQNISTEIAASSRFIEKKCNTIFRPTRQRIKQDGTGNEVMLSQVTPIININQLEIYAYNLLGLRQIVFDYQLLIDRKVGLISYPTTTNVMLSTGNTFAMGINNILMDVQTGFSQTVYNEVMTSKDLTNYKFGNANVIEFTEYPGPNSTNPPLISPCVYVNGVYVQNRVYTYGQLSVVSQLAGALIEPFSQDTWMIQQDSLVYTTNYSSLGITGITFASPLPSNSVVTVEYRYAYIPEDIVSAVAKHASINLLRSTATGIYQDLQFMGIDQVQDNNARLMANTGRWESQISGWNQDIKETIIANKSILPGIVGNNITSREIRSGVNTGSFNRL